jgi:hypothetical protein
VSSGGPQRPLGAYGLRLEGLDAAARLLSGAEPSWPRLLVEARAEPMTEGPDELTPDHASFRLRTGGRVDVDRDEGRAVISTSRPLGALEIVHPYLAPIAAVMAYWLGRESFHGGAARFGDAAWGILGERDSGKSTLLAQLGRSGTDVISDDQLVVEDEVCFAGPRSIDLRRGAAERFEETDELGVVGARERWRVQLGPVPTQLRLGGWIYLEWGDELALVEVSGSQRLELLGRHRGLTIPSRDPSRLLDLAALPSFVLRRPKEWSSLAPGADLLRHTLAG